MYNITQASTVIWIFYLAKTLDFFLFEAVNRCTGDTKLFNAANTGCDALEFSIEENTTEDLDNGIVELDPTGSWDLNIYEQSSATNKDTSLATLLGQFKLKVR